MLLSLRVGLIWLVVGSWQQSCQESETREDGETRSSREWPNPAGLGQTREDEATNRERERVEMKVPRPNTRRAVTEEEEETRVEEGEQAGAVGEGSTEERADLGYQRTQLGVEPIGETPAYS